MLVETAASLGADVPFFLAGGCALMGGRGDELAWRMPTVPMHIALVNPGVPVPTARAYAAFDESPPSASPGAGAMLAALEARDPSAVAAELYDNLTVPVMGLVREVAEALAFVSGRSGLMGSCMSGSGSTVFGVFADEADAEVAVRQARGRGWWSEATTSRTSGAAPIATDEVEEGR